METHFPKVEAGRMVQPAAREEYPVPSRAHEWASGPWKHPPRRSRRSMAYKVGIAALTATILAALVISIITQANALRLDWPEIQTEAKR